VVSHGCVGMLTGVAVLLRVAHGGLAGYLRAGRMSLAMLLVCAICADDPPMVGMHITG